MNCVCGSRGVGRLNICREATLPPANGAYASYLLVREILKLPKSEQIELTLERIMISVVTLQFDQQLCCKA